MTGGTWRVGGSRGVEVSVTDGLGRPVRDPGIGRWLERVAPPGARGTVVVALVGDGAIRRLNRRFAATDRVTDVLSFPAGDPAGGGVRGGPAGLGDIVIGMGRARRQAEEAGHSLRVELRLLALHGLLHLLGYDHDRDGGRMARIERRLRRQGGLAEGLLERAGRP